MRVLYFAILFLCAASGCSIGQSEHATERVSLPTGEIVTNESFLTSGIDNVRHNKLSFQQNESSEREFFDEIFEEDAEPLALHTTKIYRYGNRTALIIGSHIFLRWISKNGPYWYHAETKPDSAASFFLRSFLAPSDPRIAVIDENAVRSWTDLHAPYVPYAFDSVNLSENVLIIRRDSQDTTFPQFLVYSARKYGCTWEFDIERTWRANGIAPPPTPQFLIDFSVVTYSGKLPFGSSRDATLMHPGAKEVYSQALPLSSSNWKGADFSFIVPPGIRIKQHFDALLGFTDPLPTYLSIFWRRDGDLNIDWRFAKIGEWIEAEAEGYNGVSCVRYIMDPNFKTE